MAYERQIIHYAADSTTLVADISDHAESAWFELLRQGGCGAGEVVLDYRFDQRGSIAIGDYIVMAYSTGVRWYMGRVESIDESTPSGCVLNLYGMVAELAEVFPGGFGDADGIPHRYARTDWFTKDPDWSIQTWDTVSQPDEVVTLLYQQYIDGQTHIDLDSGNIETPSPLTGIQSMVFRSQESVLQIIRQLATIANNASWGVDENGDLFFKRMRTTVIDTYQEGVNLENLTMSVDRSLMCNSLLVTGDYIYDPSFFPDYFRYQGVWRQGTSVSMHGEIRKSVYIPWIRNNDDAVAFAKQFFRIYAWPSVRHVFTAKPISGLLKPWEGFLKLWDYEHANYAIQPFDRIRVNFNRDVTFDITMGQEEPMFPDYEQDLRWEIPDPDMYVIPPPSLPSLPTYTGTSFSSVSETPSVSSGSLSGISGTMTSSFGSSSESDSTGSSSGSDSGSESFDSDSSGTSSGESSSGSSGDSDSVSSGESGEPSLTGSSSGSESSSGDSSSGDSDSVSSSGSGEPSSGESESSSGSSGESVSSGSESSSGSGSESSGSGEPSSGASSGVSSGQSESSGASNSSSGSGEPSSGGSGEPPESSNSGSSVISSTYSDSSSGSSSGSESSSGDSSSGSESSGYSSGDSSGASSGSSAGSSSSGASSSSGSGSSGTSGGEIICDCCGNPVPETLYASMNGYGGVIPLLFDGATVTLTYNSGASNPSGHFWQWDGGTVIPIVGDHVFITFILRCYGTISKWEFRSSGPYSASKQIDIGGNCQPLNLQFDNLTPSGQSGYDATVTE